MRGRLQAKDVDTVQFLSIVYDLNAKDGQWAMRWDVEDSFNPRFPEKLILVKADKLIKRGLLQGCTCGCRGDFVVSEAGCELLGKPFHNVIGY